jgi:hypothetical protein
MLSSLFERETTDGNEILNTEVGKVRPQDYGTTDCGTKGEDAEKLELEMERRKSKDTGLKAETQETAKRTSTTVQTGVKRAKPEGKVMRAMV